MPYAGHGHLLESRVKVQVVIAPWLRSEHYRTKFGRVAKGEAVEKCGVRVRMKTGRSPSSANQARPILHFFARCLDQSTTQTLAARSQRSCLGKAKSRAPLLSPWATSGRAQNSRGAGKQTEDRGFGRP